MSDAEGHRALGVFVLTLVALMLGRAFCEGLEHRSPPEFHAVVSPAQPQGVRLLVGERMDLERVSVRDLCLVAGVGKALAERILNARCLDHVKGVGPKLLERLRAKISSNCR